MSAATSLTPAVAVVMAGEALVKLNTGYRADLVTLKNPALYTLHYGCSQGPPVCQISPNVARAPSNSPRQISSDGLAPVKFGAVGGPRGGVSRGRHRRRPAKARHSGSSGYTHLLLV